MTREKDAAAIELPAPPDHLSSDSQTLWRQVVAEMATHRSVGQPTRTIPPSPGRLALLTVALEALGRATQARLQIAKDGLTTKTETTGALHAHPLLKVEKDSMALFQRCWTSLRLEWSPPIDGGHSW